MRCSVVVGTERELAQVASFLAQADATDDDVLVVRLKNRFAKPMFNGYRDALYSIRVKVPDTAPPAFHVCEMQLHLAHVIAHKHATHVFYEYFRSFFAGNMAAVDERMAVLMDLGESVRRHKGNLHAVVREAAEQWGTHHGVRLRGLERLLAEMMAEYKLARVLVERRRKLAVLCRVRLMFKCGG